MIDLAQPAFPDDDGVADPRVRAMLQDEFDPLAVACAWREVRLLACVIAVADRVDESGADKDSHMAVVSMVSADGRRGILAFTGVDSLRTWDPAARPVPAMGRDIARAALEEGAAAVVVDVAGPRTVIFEGTALVALADALDLSAVEAVVRECLAGLSHQGAVTAVARDVRGEGLGIDVLVEVTGSGEAVARALADQATLVELVPGGIGVREA